MRAFSVGVETEARSLPLYAPYRSFFVTPRVPTETKRSYHYSFSSPCSSVILDYSGYGANYYYKYDVDIPVGTTVNCKVWRASELYSSSDSASFYAYTEENGEAVLGWSVKGTGVVDKTVVIDKPITILYAMYRSGDHSRIAYFDLTYDGWQ